MPTTFRAYHPDQILLLAPDLREWVPEGHLSHQVSDLVDSLDLRSFYAPYAGDGRRNAPYEPSMMLKVLIYGYATGVYSSRGIARKLEEDVAFRMLAAGNFPQHRTICEFRRRHLEDFGRLFVEVVRVAREMGLVRFGTLSLDGTKVRAKASKRKAMSYGRMLKEQARLEKEIGALLAGAVSIDAEEDARYGADVRGDELPVELQRRQVRLAAIRAARERLEASQRAVDDARGRKPGQKRNPKGGRPYKRAYGEPDPKAQSNFTDPESRIMKTSAEGFQQCYNAQTVVDAKRQIIVAAHLGSAATDQGLMLPLLDGVEETFGVKPAVVLADAGYCNEEDLATLEERGIDGYVALGREGKGGRRQGDASGDASHGRKTGEPGRSGPVCEAQVALGGAQRMDQGDIGLPTLQLPGSGKGACRVGPGLPGLERQADGSVHDMLRGPLGRHVLADSTCGKP